MNNYTGFALLRNAFLLPGAVNKPHSETRIWALKPLTFFKILGSGPYARVINIYSTCNSFFYNFFVFLINFKQLKKIDLGTAP